MNKRDVAIVIGHDWSSKGAFSRIVGQPEYDYNKEVAEMIGCDVYTHSPNISYKNKMRATYQKLSHYALTLELHYNAASPSAHGAEALFFHTNPLGKRAAELFAEMVSSRYGTRNRGAKQLSNLNQRGYWAVASGIPTGLILEPFFGTHKEAYKFKNKCAYAGLISEFIEKI